MTEVQVKKHVGEFTNPAESSSGIFCWSTSHSTCSKCFEKEISTSAASNGLITHIPGLQVHLCPLCLHSSLLNSPFRSWDVWCNTLTMTFLKTFVMIFQMTSLSQTRIMRVVSIRARHLLVQSLAVKWPSANVGKANEEPVWVSGHYAVPHTKV